MPAVAGVVILFQETRELVPIESSPACPQAGEKFEFADGKNRHQNACLVASGRDADVAHDLGTKNETPAHYIFCMPAYCQPL